MVALSLKYRIALVTFLFQLLVLSLQLWHTFSTSREADLNQLVAREEVFLDLISEMGRRALLTDEPEDFQLFIAPFVRAPHLKRIMLLDQSGRVVASSDPQDLGLLHPELPAVDHQLWKVKKLDNAAETLGSIAVNFSRHELAQRTQLLLARGIPVVFAGIIVSALVGLGLGTLLTRRLKKLEQATQRMGAGDMEVTVSIPGHDEIGRLAQVFNEMSANLRSQFLELEQIQQALAFQAHHDPLSGLPNRTLFDLRCGQALEAARQEGRQAALLFMDLDHFKNINDSYGHQVGDCVLRDVAARLTMVLKDQYLIARLGGDEFCVLMEQLGSEQQAIDLAQSVLDSLTAPLCCEQHEFFLSASIGICFFPQDGDDVTKLLRNADTAMYRAKAAGRGGYRLYSREQTTTLRERVSMESRLRRAVERGELRLHYQPQIDFSSDTAVGVEALARWSSPEFGLVKPSKFIPIAEESGLIIPIGEWILFDACTQMQQWRTEKLGLQRMAVNLSALQIQRGDIVDLVRRALDHTGLPANCLELEITEGYILQETERAVETLQQLRDLGVSIAIDDFGTTSRAATVAQAVVDLGRTLGLTVIGEGVEQERHATALKSWGCHEGQGFLYSPAVEPDQLSSLAPWMKKP
jgi:diguanylate cyclase (GGDEF)-like protein